MSQLIVTAALLASAWFAYKWFRRETQRVDAELQRAGRRINRARRRPSSGTVNLRLDPSTGIYLPAGE